MINAYEINGQVVIVNRGNNGELIKTKVPSSYVFYVLKSELDRVPSLKKNLERSRHVRAIKEEQSWYRIEWTTNEARLAFLHQSGDEEAPNVFKRNHIGIYEGDVSPVNRYCLDHAVSISKPKRFYFDLETDSRVKFAHKEKMRILSYAWCGDDGCSGAEVLTEDTDEAEQNLLRNFWRAAERYDQLIAWNGDGFDFPVIKARTKMRKLDVDLNRFLYLDQMLVYKKYNVASESGDEKTSLKLQSVAMQLIGEGKDDFDASKTYEEWAKGGAARDRLLKYNAKDTELLPKIEAKCGYIDLYQTIAEATGCFPDTFGLNPTHQVDMFLLRLGLENDQHFATKTRTESSEKYQGAYVQQPSYKGIARGIHVADFASLYPSMIITWNISPETANFDHCSGKIPDGMCRAPETGVCFYTEKVGMLPKALKTLIGLRKEWNTKKASLPPGTQEWKDADRKSTAYKVVANSFYGVIGTPYSRFFDFRVAESVSTSGRWLIKQTVAEAEKQGWDVGYVDTDSIFVGNCQQTEFDDFVNKVNVHLYPRLLKEQGCSDNAIKLAYEKAFDRIVFTAAKKYVGTYLHYKGSVAQKDSKPEIKGLEYKRGDTSKFARQMQEEVIHLFCSGNELVHDYIKIIEKWKTTILESALEKEDICITKALTKELKEYATKTKKDGSQTSDLAHVAIAKILKGKGEEIDVGSKISYVVIDGSVSPMSVIPLEEYTGVCDRAYLWEHLVYPATYRLLAAMFPEHASAFDDHLSVRPKKTRKKKTADDHSLSIFDFQK